MALIAAIRLLGVPARSLGGTNVARCMWFGSSGASPAKGLAVQLVPGARGLGAGASSAALWDVIQ